MSLITYLGRVRFADRAFDEALGEEIAALGIRAPAVVVDPAGIAAFSTAAELRDRLVLALPAEVRPAILVIREGAARLEDAERAAALIAAAGCDGLIGIGGVGALDLARLAAIAGGEPGRPAALWRGELAGAARAPLARLPVVLVPTTTAGGVGLCPGLRIAGPDGHRAVAVGGAVPALVLCDPTLTLAQPPEATAAAGMDVIAHCIEAYLGTAWNPPADGIALEGLRRAAALPRAVADGGDLDARRELLAGALCAGLAAQKGLGGVHALAHAFEDVATEIAGPHGRLHAALLPPCLDFNAPAVGDRFEALRAALGLASGMPLATALAELGDRLSLPTRLGPLGLDRVLCERVAHAAEAEPANRTNPRHATARDYRRLIEAAM